ncbi:ABC transporter permease [Paenibacillus psychroresistens]|uniref:ABC transporter permease n=1 Tax=Paenibacillus psychroresistens TaxID=1778678 RepID=A0A6B8RIW7_9BACL|nr:ABC transporter permease [Paenibacillus psychroresistens]QGQ95522.1 ABC transporter permease [Paenibacillus psychroresistens]
MALLIMILRKMIKNKWLELSLLFGLIFTVALVSSMPIYTQAILQRTLTKDLQNLQIDKGLYPGVYEYSASIGDNLTTDQKRAVFKTVDSFMAEQKNNFGMDVQIYSIERSTSHLNLKPVDPKQPMSDKVTSVDLTALTHMADHVRLVDGHFPVNKLVDGAYEVAVTDNFLNKTKMVLGNEFTATTSKALGKEVVSVRVKLVGVVAQKDPQDLYWNHKLDGYSSSFFINDQLFEDNFVTNNKFPLFFQRWFYALDYNTLKLNQVSSFINTYDDTNKYFSKYFSIYSKSAPAVDIIHTYYEKEKQLKMMLFSINVPVIILLAFYLYMVANLITDRQKTEIAVLRSRGASRLQILLGYLTEGILLGGLAFIIGPAVGLFFTKLLGASNGFLEFVQRATLDANLSRDAYQYALIAVVGSIVMTIFPAFLATRATIVDQKRQSAREIALSFWHKYYLDVLVLGVSIYGLQSFKRRMHDMMALGLNSGSFKIDPLLFVIPSLFLLGSALLALRLYPWIIRLIFWVGRKWWSSTLYMILLQVGRSTIKYQFIMVFLSLTLATGLFSASAARTINKNNEDKIRYSNGADITMKVKWDSDEPPPASSGPPGAPAAPAAPVPKVFHYIEPPFQPYSHLPGVEAAAKVFTKDDAFVEINSKSVTTRLMGIDTNEFGQVAWMRDGLMDHHFYDYLNLIASDPSAVLISRSVADELEVKVGDHINVSWTDSSVAQVNVYGIIDYWPGWNPLPAQVAKDSEVVTDKPHIIVGHLSFIQDNISQLPYDIWLKLKPDASLNAFYKTLTEKNWPVTGLNDTRQAIIKAKNEPFELAINGVMTLGFIISIFISFFGFLLYWVLSLSGRTLQFGILRAMGISFRQLIGLLLLEQLLTSGAAVLMGVLIGNLANRLFVPLFQLSFNTVTQVPPFHVVFDASDYVRLYVILGFMLVLGLVILGWMLSKIKIHQAVKLGED